MEHVMFQLSVLDPNRPGFVFCKKKLIPMAQDH